MILVFFYLLCKMIPQLMDSWGNLNLEAFLLKRVDDPDLLNTKSPHFLDINFLACAQTSQQNTVIFNQIFESVIELRFVLLHDVQEHLPNRASQKKCD